MSVLPRVYIVILNWNGWQDTLECLESVFRQNYPDFQVVVCDNDSSDDSLSKISSWAKGELEAPDPGSHPLARLSRPVVGKPIDTVCLTRDEAEQTSDLSGEPPLILIQTGGNLGFAGGNNVGLRHLLRRDGDGFVWILNNDTVVEPDALRRMIEHSEKLRARGIPNTCGNTVCFYDDPTVIQALGGARYNRWTGIASQTLGRYLSINERIDHSDYQKQMDYITGCSWLLPMAFIREVGLMEERYFLYYEEIDWVLRSRDRYQISYCPEAMIYHKEGSSIGSKSMNRDASMLAEFYTSRNKFRVAAKFFPWALPTVFLGTVAQAINRLRQRTPAKAWMLLKVAMGKQSYP